jgi:hypothetical protein
MALGRLLSDVRALNAELPSVAKQLRDVTDIATSEAALKASESASRAAGQAAEATTRSNQAAAEAARAIASIPPVEGAEFRITADDSVRRLTDLATDEEGVARRIGSGGGGGGGGSFDTGFAGRQLLGQIARGGGLLNQRPQGGGNLIQPVPQAPMPPTQGERAIVNELRNLREAIGQSIEASGVSFRMGSKS